MSDSKKAAFLSKKEREEAALARLNAKRHEQDLKSKVSFDCIY